MIEYLSRLFADLKEESGQTMAEYAVVLGVITIAVVVTLGLLSTKISAVLNSVIAAMKLRLPSAGSRVLCGPGARLLLSPAQSPRVWELHEDQETHHNRRRPGGR